MSVPPPPAPLAASLTKVSWKDKTPEQKKAEEEARRNSEQGIAPPPGPPRPAPVMSGPPPPPLQASSLTKSSWKDKTPEQKAAEDEARRRSEHSTAEEKQKLDEHHLAANVAEQNYQSNIQDIKIKIRKGLSGKTDDVGYLLIAAIRKYIQTQQYNRSGTQSYGE